MFKRLQELEGARQADVRVKYSRRGYKNKKRAGLW
jgi:hypothetical protein